MGINGQKLFFQANGGRWRDNGMETAWNSFLSTTKFIDKRFHHWMLLQYYIRRKSHCMLFPPFCSTISHHLPENSIFGHLPPFAPAYGRPLDPTSTFIDKNVITGCYCNNTHGEKAIPGCFHPIVSPSPAIYLKIPFLAIYPHLRLLMGDPLTPPSLLLTKMLLLDAIAVIHTEKKLFQAVSTPLSHYLPPFT